MPRRYDQPAPEDGPSARQTRTLWIIAVIVALMIGMWFWIGWYSLLILGVIVWASWDGIGFSGKAETAINKKGWSSSGGGGI